MMFKLVVLSKVRFDEAQAPEVDVIVWHSGLTSPSPVGGVAQSITLLARGLGRAGHEVVIISPGRRAVRVEAVNASPRVVVASVEFRAGRYVAHALRELAAQLPPSLIHLHWALRYPNSALARWAFHRGTPYVLHPRGALAARALQRRGLSKRAYWAALERRIVHRASAVIGNTRGDIDDLLAVLPRYQGRTAVIPNAVAGPGDLPLPRHHPRTSHDSVASPAYRCIYLGRWDVEHKGLDRLATIARHSDDLSFDLHTDGRPTTRRRLERTVRASLPENVTVRPPVYGTDKWRALARADAYVQLSRWESFGNSIAEAVVVGLPVFLSPEMHLGQELDSIGACKLIDPDHLDMAADSIVRVLSDRERCLEMIEAGRTFAASVTEDEVARAVGDLYADVLRGG